VALMHEAGVPPDALQFLPGDGAAVGAPLTAAPAIAGVVFTGSTEVAGLINRALAANAAPDAALVAETGGINAMIVDSTALTEQVVRDVLASAFQSAGQRCSALRVLYVQEEAYDRTLKMLSGAMDALRVGDPWDPAVDVGSVIDAEAETGIRDYLAAQPPARVLKTVPVPSTGRFVPPSIVGVDGIAAVEREVFGPVLHLARYRARDLDRVVDAINARGYGLTFGLHSRIDDRVEQVTARLHVGNAYVNRNQIGAIVGSQPFGGEGLSGTGPKAGGPLYLPRLHAPAAAEAPPAPSGETVPAARLQQLLGQLPPAAAPVDPALLRVGLADAGTAATAALAAAAALPPRVRDMPGPTGESNRLSLVPRGRVLCLGTSADLVRAQAIQALAAGNAVLAVAAEATDALAPLARPGLPLRTCDGQIDPEALTTLDGLALVAAAGPAAWLATLRRALAARAGPIVPLETAPVAPERYVLERHICIDTTAAGGNASLLAASA